MPELPQALLQSLHDVNGFDEAAFTHVHQSGVQVTSIRINPRKWPRQNSKSLQETFSGFLSSFALTNVPWSQYGYYMAQRPSFTFDPFFHAGCYYVQEASSLFLEQAVLQTVDVSQPLKVLDLCAAPGGKSTHLQSLLSDASLLVSNEVIRSRVPVLKQNSIKWGSENVVITNNDPQQFARLEGFFDVVVVDAPCSGSGLFRRDADAINEWSLENVQLCYGRQKRILADVFPALKEGGILIYSTCSYSKEEDEDIADWMVQTLGMQPVALHIDEAWHIVETSAEKTGAKGYRFFPYNVQGEGFYLAVFKKTTAPNEPRLKTAALEPATAAERTAAQKWLQPGDYELFRFPYLHAVPKKLSNDYALLKNYVTVQYAGVAVGEVIRDKLVPEHALALSTVVSSHVPALPVDYETAIRYLQRSDMNIETATKGWEVVSYKGHNIGWINALPNRINNYYPKEWRILKQHPGFEK